MAKSILSWKLKIRSGCNRITLNCGYPNFINRAICKAGEGLDLTKRMEYVLHVGKMQRCLNLTKAGLDAHLSILYTCSFWYFRLEENASLPHVKPDRQTQLQKPFLRNGGRSGCYSAKGTFCNLETPIILNKLRKSALLKGIHSCCVYFV